jgi:ABC-type transport system involved in multi-copper enzyme maturation permease subunit
MNLQTVLSSGVLAAAENGGNISALSWVLVGIGCAAFLVALAVLRFTTKAGIIARATTKESIRQPVFLLALIISAVVLLINTVLPFFTLGDDIKMLKDCGLATLLISGLLIAIWTASTSIADEIEGKTAMTLLSKPINRRQFVVGKYIGILQAVLIYLVPLAILFLALIYYKVGYDAKEASAATPPTPAECWAAATQVIPGLLLLFMEIAVLSAVSVAISTRLPMVVNLTTCFAVFVIGHLTPQLVQSGFGQLEFVTFMARLIATMLPSLELFNTSAAVATGDLVPPIYIGSAALYGICYSVAAILLAFILFEDRDLA